MTGTKKKSFLNLGVKLINKGSHICELNNDTDESPSHLALAERQLYTYHAVEVYNVTR